MYVHKKCTKLKPNELKRKNWIGEKCTNNDSENFDDMIKLRLILVSHLGSQLPKIKNKIFYMSVS